MLSHQREKKCSQQCPWWWHSVLWCQVICSSGNNQLDLIPHIMMTSWNGNIFRITGSFVRGNHRSPVVVSPHKGQWRGALIFSLISAWANGWATNRDADDLRRHRAHYDVTVMYIRNRHVKQWIYYPLLLRCNLFSQPVDLHHPQNRPGLSRRTRPQDVWKEIPTVMVAPDVPVCRDDGSAKVGGKPFCIHSLLPSESIWGPFANTD